MLSKNQLQKLYNSGLSMQEISDKTGENYNKIVYWMKKYRISRRSRSDAMYTKYNPNGDPFQVKSDLTKSEIFLKGLGLGLYWGEGTKSNKHSVRLGNSDPYLIKQFLEFLNRLYSIDTNKLRFGLQVFNDMDADVAKRFWLSHLNVKEDKFQKVIVTPARSLGSYKNKTKYGVLTIYFSNVKLRNIIIDEIESMKI